MTGRLPPLDRCALCHLTRHLSAHQSRRDGRSRRLCTPCFSAVTVAEDAGRAVDWAQARALEEALSGLLSGGP